MLKEVQEYRSRGKIKKVYIRPFAWNLRAPTHMEWTPDGRLFAVERTSGTVKDVTRGGDMNEASPVVWGLEGPSSMCALEDGRFLITEFWGGRIREISKGGDARKLPIYAENLKSPYSLALDATGRLLVTEYLCPGLGELTEISNSGHHKPVLRKVPSSGTPGFEGYTPPEAWPKNWEAYHGGCGSWGIDPRVHPELSYTFALSISGLGIILGVDAGSHDYSEVVATNAFARGLGYTGGMIAHPFNGLIYVTRPLRGDVIAVDPRESHNYTFDPPVVSGLNSASCVRFDRGGDRMFVCSSANGIIWLVEGVSS